MSLVKEVNPDARRKGTYFDFAIVFPNPNHNRGKFDIFGMTVSPFQDIHNWYVVIQPL